MTEEKKEAKSDTITIKKDALWKYSTFVLAAIVLVGVIAIFAGGDRGSPTGAVVGPPSVNSGTTGVPLYKEYAKQLRLDQSQFDKCLDSGKYANKVGNDLQEGTSAGIRGTPGFIINGQLLSGAQPFQSFQQIIEAELINPNSAQAIELTDEDHVKGDFNAPVTITEFSDFECPFCGRFYTQTLSQIESEYIDTGKANFVYKHFPLSSIHPNAQKAAEASECAAEQGKFWEMHDILFEKGV